MSPVGTHAARWSGANVAKSNQRPVASFQTAFGAFATTYAVFTLERLGWAMTEVLGVHVAGRFRYLFAGLLEHKYGPQTGRAAGHFPLAAMAD